MPWTEYPPGNTPYVEYARMDALLDLQHPRTGLSTEYEFIILSQVKELLFTLLHQQLTEAAMRIRESGIDQALRVLRRVPPMQRLLLSCWEPLSGLTSGEFAEFRDVLGSAWLPVVLLPPAGIPAGRQAGHRWHERGRLVAFDRRTPLLSRAVVGSFQCVIAEFTTEAGGHAHGGAQPGSGGETGCRRRARTVACSVRHR
ncbi:MAG: tryptophan 2,3-dioxygenase family protein [Pseudonocardiaceae bacterium]